MAEPNLSNARIEAERVRFCGDIAPPRRQPLSLNTTMARDDLYQQAVEVSPLMTPNLWKSYQNVCARLEIPLSSSSVFIYSSRDVQGECLSGEPGGCVIRLSSGLVDLLEEDEFEFVVGHELGHFLLDHGSLGLRDSSTIVYLRNRRAQEISVDRIGLVACGSLNAALRALMKTASGLTDRHLRFDVRAFIAQLKKIEREENTSDWSGSTHPSILIRAKALLWFSLSDYFVGGRISYSREQMRKIDERIERDLQKFIDGAVTRRIDVLKRDLLLWMTTLEMVRSGVFSIQVQSRMKAHFGDEAVDKLRGFLADLTKMEAEQVTFERLKSARVELERLIPDGLLQEVRQLETIALQLVGDDQRQ